MEITELATCLPITVICLLVGLGCKCFDKIRDEAIPVIVGIAGGLIGIPALYVMPDFPASDIITAIAVGVNSGLAAVGLNQIYKQFKKFKEEE